MREHARQQLAATQAGVVMLVHDWCKLSDRGHASKREQAQLAQANHHGDELTSVLAVNGAPLAPMEVHLKTADGVLSTRAVAPPDVHHLEQVLPTMVEVGQGKKQKKKQVSIPGPPLTLRWVVVQVRQADGRVLAAWHLLTNAPAGLLSAEQLARCYDWRWRIESDFKRLPSHGQELEHWQQETGAAIFRRLLVATMACMTVWQLQSDTRPAAIQLKDTLIRLGGRLMKRNVPHTAPALLAGLWGLLSMTEYLENHDLNDLKQLVRDIQLPFPILRCG